MPRRRAACRNRISDVAFRQRCEHRARPGGARGGDEGVALRCCFQQALARTREGERKGVDVGERGGIAALPRPPRLRKQDRVVARASMLQQRAQPVLEARGIAHIAGFNRPFQPV